MPTTLSNISSSSQRTSPNARDADVGEDDRRRESVGQDIAQHHTEADARSLASTERPPSSVEKLPPAKIYPPLSFPVLALLASASVFGTLARLGLQGLTTYDGQSVFSLAYAQALGCFVMGLCLSLKEPIGQLYVHVSYPELNMEQHPEIKLSYGPLYTALTTGKPYHPR
jgi:fluoride exporter